MIEKCNIIIIISIFLATDTYTHIKSGVAATSRLHISSDSMYLLLCIVLPFFPRKQ